MTVTQENWETAEKKWKNRLRSVTTGKENQSETAMAAKFAKPRYGPDSLSPTQLEEIHHHSLRTGKTLNPDPIMLCSSTRKVVDYILRTYIYISIYLYIMWNSWKEKHNTHTQIHTGRSSVVLRWKKGCWFLIKMKSLAERGGNHPSRNSQIPLSCLILQLGFLWNVILIRTAIYTGSYVKKNRPLIWLRTSVDFSQLRLSICVSKTQFELRKFNSNSEPNTRALFAGFWKSMVFRYLLYVFANDFTGGTIICLHFILVKFNVKTFQLVETL